LGFGLYGRKSKHSPKIAAISITNIEGFESYYHEIVKILMTNKENYMKKFQSLKCLNNTCTFGN